MNPKPTPRAAAPRWTRRAEARPEEILEAALDEFTERGFDAARMEDIAKRAGLSKAGVYLYFESKDALLKALIDAKVAPFAANAEAIARMGAGDPLTALRMIATAAVTMLGDAQNARTPRLFLGLSGRFPEITEYYRSHVVEIALAALDGLMRAAMQQGRIRTVAPREAVRAFIGPLVFEALWAHVLRGETAFADPAKLVDSHLNNWLQGLRP